MLKFDHFPVIDRLWNNGKEEISLGLCFAWIEKW